MTAVTEGLSKLCVITEVFLTDARPDQGLPGEQPEIDNTLPEPQPHPDHELPGDQPVVSPPIYYPVYPDNSLPGDQPEVDIPEFPTNPIVLPPGSQLPEELPDVPLEVKVGWTAETGWVVVLVPTGEHVTPSR